MEQSKIHYAKITLILLTLPISACATKPVSICEERTPLALTAPAPLNLENPTTIILTDKNATSVFDTFKKNGVSEPVVIGVSPTGYEMLARNFEKIQGRIEILQEMVKQYQLYYEPKK